MEVFQFDETKIRKINAFMQKFTDADNGKERRALYLEYEDVLDTVQGLDLFYTHFYGKDSDKSVDEIIENADLFVNIFSSSLESHQPAFDHPYFDLVINENKAITERFDKAKKIIKRKQLKQDKAALIKSLGDASEIKKMFMKRENILFPHLENVTPSQLPFKVLWQLHDEAKTGLKDLVSELNKDTFDEKEVVYLIGQFYFLLYGIMQKEELIILPAAHHLLKTDELNNMVKEMFDYGFAYENPEMPTLPNASKTNDKTDVPEVTNLQESGFKSNTGHLSFEQIGLILKTIPLDITYVDEHDKVVYYNDRKERHFPRSPSVIGRLVENCHPPKSVHTVKQIVEDFKLKKRDMAEFYIKFQEAFLYITYYAVRDHLGIYKGVLEVSQDVTHIRDLSGEKRLLDE